MNKSINLCLIVLLLAYLPVCFSKQVHFSKVENDANYQFNYQWLDIKNNHQSLNFSLEKSAIFNKFRSFKTYKPKMAERYISANIVKYFRNEPIKDVQISYNTHSETIELSSKNNGKLISAKRKVSEVEQQCTEEYLDKNYYLQFVTHTNIKAIKPDHVKFAKLSVIDLQPLKSIILDNVSINDIRKTTDYILGFVQSIPYSTLESRADSAGSGFNPPLKLLWENQGDCDSKVTLTASLLRMLMPRMKIVLVFIDNHALIGIDVLPQGDEVTITLDGVTYLLGEPTGPAKLSLGRLGESSRLAILQGQYVAEKFF